jgi:hypothetical protein
MNRPEMDNCMIRDGGHMSLHCQGPLAHWSPDLVLETHESQSEI